MRIVIAGAGAVGSVIAGYLHAAGDHQVSVLARGPHLAAIRARGLVVDSRGKRWDSRVAASDDPRDLGPQDLVISTFKSYSLPALAPTFTPLLTPSTLVVAAQNGIPWWFFHGLEGEMARPFEVVDPGGAVWRALGPERAIGAVIYMPSAIVEPGVARHVGKLGLTLGAPRAGDHRDALDHLSAIVAKAGIEATRTDRIRDAIWSKLQLNLASGPLSVLTEGKLGPVSGVPGLQALRIRLMRECLGVARAWGADLPDDVEARAQFSPGAPNHKESMLQDYDAGRPLELDSILTAPLELGRRRGLDMATTETIGTLTRLKAESR